MSLVCARPINNQIALIPEFNLAEIAMLSLPESSTQTYSSAYRIITQRTVFVVSDLIEADVLLVGGGGGGGRGHNRAGAAGGGGGGGKVVSRRLTLTPGEYEVIVGAAGTDYDAYCGSDGKTTTLRNLTLGQALLEAAPGLGGRSGYIGTANPCSGGQGGGSGGGASGAKGGDRGSAGANNPGYADAKGGIAGGWDDAAGLLTSLSSMFVYGLGGVAATTSMYDGGGGGGGLRLIDPSVVEQVATSGTCSDGYYSGTPGTGGRGFGAGGGGGTATTGKGGMGVQGLCVLLFQH